MNITKENIKNLCKRIEDIASELDYHSSETPELSAYANELIDIAGYVDEISEHIIDTDNDTDIRYLVFNLDDYLCSPSEIVFSNDRFEDWEIMQNTYPSLFDEDNTFYLKIDVETGKVINWPVGIDGYFYDIKLVDGGIYKLLNKNNKIIHNYIGYVPKCLSIEDNGWGDYLIFKIKNDGYINNWKFNEKYKSELMG